MFLRSFFHLTVCLALVLAWSGEACADDPITDIVAPASISSPPWTSSIMENPASSYRHTVDGWVDTTHWRVGGDEGKVRFIDNIHPVVWMLLVVFLSSGLAVLASDDESVSQFWKESERNQKPTHARNAIE